MEDIGIGGMIILKLIFENLSNLAQDKDHWPYFESTVTKKDFCRQGSDAV
jgi:hypothetical protein